MRKFVFVLAFAAFATLSFAAVNSVVTNPIEIENFDEKPKKEEKKSESKDENKKACTKSADKKSGCSAAHKSSCSKKK